jgi:hypothetical protein
MKTYLQNNPRTITSVTFASLKAMVGVLVMLTLLLVSSYLTI